MRIRSIKPEFWRSDDITALSREDRLLFIGLWSYVDDNGVGIDDYRQIAADLFALEDDQKDVREFVRDGLATLSRRFLIARYQANGKAYLFITGWKKHQRIDKPAKGRYPEPPPDFKPPTSEDVPETDHVATPSRESRDTLAPGAVEQRNRGTGEQESAGRFSKSGAARAHERIGPAHSPRAHRLVEAYAASCRRRPPARVRAKLAHEVDGLIDVDWPDEDITAAIDLWSTKGLDPTLLASVAHELINRKPAQPQRNATDDRVAALLGESALNDAFCLDAPPLRAIGGGTAC